MCVQIDGVVMKLLSVTANPQLADKVADYLDVPVTKVRVNSFADSESFVSIEENVRGEDCFVLQSTSAPANERLMELLICIDALRRASAQRITAVIPYYGYARQDRKTKGRTPITAKLVANLIRTAGADRVLTLELHAGQIQGFFDTPTDNLYADRIVEDYIRSKYKLKDMLIVSPDVGGAVRARQLADRLGLDIAIVEKMRPAPGESLALSVIGEVKDMHCMIYDDIVDSGGTLVNAAEILKSKGAKSVVAMCVHGVLSKKKGVRAQDRIEDSALDALIITDTIETPDGVNGKTKKIQTLSVAPLIGEAIRRISNNESLSKLFETTY